MEKLTVNAIVVHQSGNLRGVIESVIEPESDHPRAWVRWDDGTYSTHLENELQWATTERPVMHKKLF